MWTLQEDASEPPNYPNAWKNPFAPLGSGIQPEPADDPLRGPGSPRHRPWNAAGAEPTSFDWVPLDESLQWTAFQRTVLLLRSRGDRVLVIIGPFNEHMIAPDQIKTFHAMRDQIISWLKAYQFLVLVPQTLPSNLYADASHPLTRGYARLADELMADLQFQRFANSGGSPVAH